MIPAPRWTEAELEASRIRSIEMFREERMQESLQAYLEAFRDCEMSVANLLRTSGDLLQLSECALQILTDRAMLEAFRYLSGPPISQDDLKTLAEANLSPGRVRSDPEMVRRVVDVVSAGLDRRRFPWVERNQPPSESEKDAAILASAALMAGSRVSTARRNDGKTAQELMVEQALMRAGLRKVPTRMIATLNQAPARGDFCRETQLGPGYKADFVLSLWDYRVMAIECKVSNSAVNSVKRLNREAAAKAVAWLRDFGTTQTVPVAILSGVYKLHNLEDAQRRGLTLFWAHDLDRLLDWIASTRSN